MPAAMKPGDVVADRFELERPGRGAVWRARDLRSGEPCALKVLPDEGAAARERFEEEMALRATLDHPALARHVAHGVTGDGLRYVATEWLDGVDLRERLDRSALEVTEALALARHVAGALAEAHARGLLHRGLTPSNVFLPGGDPSAARLLDLGSARGPLSRFVTGAGAGLAPGGPAYLAPEQAQGDPQLDPRADVFSLGCILYECLAGRPAFNGAYALAATAKVLLASPPPVRRLRREVPAPVDALVGRMLSKARDARPGGGADLLALVRRLEGEPSEGGGVQAPSPVSSGADGGADPWGYLGDAMTAPPTPPKLVWLVLALGDGAASGAPDLPGRVGDVASAFHAGAQQLHDGSVLLRIDHERGGATPSGHDVGALVQASPDDDPANENRRHAMILGILRKARIQAQGGERAARCALALRGATQGRPAALTLVPPSRPGEWLSAPAIDLAARLLDRGLRAGVQGIVMDEEAANLLDADLFSVITGPGGVIELRGEWTGQPQA